MKGDLVITIANPGWHGKRTVVVAELAVSWEVSKIGRLSCKLPWRHAALLTNQLGRANLKGAWVAWRSARLGLWGGIVKRNPTDIGDGLMELSADSFHVLFKGIVTRRTYLTSTGSAGALAINVITDSATDRQLYIDDIQADDTGPTMSIEWRGDDLYDVLDGIAQDSGYEWTVALQDDWTRVAEFRRRIGSDKRNRVLYADGYNVLPDGTVSPSLDDLANVIHAVPGDTLWEKAGGAIVADPDSRTAYGRYETTKRYVNLSGVASLETRGRSDLILSAQPAIPAAIAVPANDRSLSLVREGDTIRYWSAKQNARYALRVMSRSFDAKDGAVKLAGDCTVEAA